MDRAIEDEIARRRQAGERPDDIAKALGISRSAVYVVLRDRGLTAPQTSARAVTASELLKQLTEAQRTIGQLEQEVERLRMALERRSC